MEIDRYKQLVNDPRRTQEELKTMLANALAKGEIDYAGIVEYRLDDVFPGWNDVRTRKGGSTPTVAGFRGVDRHFDTAKEAYCWLIEKFIEAYPTLFESPNWETIFVAAGRQRNYFGRDLKKMFHGSPHLASDPNFYSKLPSGWYVNLNLSNREKLRILCNFAAVAQFKHNVDWRWEVEGAPKETDLEWL